MADKIALNNTYNFSVPRRATYSRISTRISYNKFGNPSLKKQ
jgi:hypothetical protein